MRPTTSLSLFAGAVLLAACGTPTEAASDVTAPVIAAEAPLATTVSPPDGTESRGVLLETIDAGRYTYMRVDMCGAERWVAVPAATVAVGDNVRWPTGSEMADFHSPSLDKTFAVLEMAGLVRVDAEAPPCGEGVTAVAAPPSTPAVAAPAVAAPTVASPVRTPGERVPVEQVVARRAELAGTVVTVEGTAVRFLNDIMQTNWIHLDDGTTEEPLRVTTHDVITEGAHVVITGPVSIDRDFGGGYSYDVIIEDASVSAQ